MLYNFIYMLYKPSAKFFSVSSKTFGVSYFLQTNFRNAFVFEKSCSSLLPSTSKEMFLMQLNKVAFFLFTSLILSLSIYLSLSCLTLMLAFFPFKAVLYL